MQMDHLFKRLLVVPLLILALVFSACPVCVHAGETYDLVVGSLVVDNYNKDDIAAALKLHEPGAVVSGSARYDSASNTLYLNNFRYEGVGYQPEGSDVRSALRMDSSGYMELVITGSNYFTLTTYGDDNGTYGDDEDDTVASTACGGYFLCHLSVKPDPDSTGWRNMLVFHAPETDRERFELELDDSIGLWMKDGNLWVNGCTLKAEADVARSSTGLLMYNGLLSLLGGAIVQTVGAETVEGDSHGALLSRKAESCGNVILDEGSQLICTSGWVEGGSYGLWAKDVYVYGDSSLTVESDVAGFDSCGMDVVSLRTGDGNAEIRAESWSSSMGESIAIKAGSVEAEGAEISADGGDCGIFADDGISFAGCQVSAEAVTAINCDSLTLTDGSSVNAVGEMSRDPSYASCGVSTRLGAPSIAAGCELRCSGGELDEWSEGGSYGLCIGQSNLDLTPDDAGLLIASGYTKAISCGSTNVSVTGGYIRRSDNVDGSGAERGSTKYSGGVPQYDFWTVQGSDKYLYVRGSTQLVTTLTCRQPDKDLYTCIIDADKELDNVVLMAVSFDAGGKLLKTKLLRLQSDPEMGMFDPPVGVGVTKLTFTGMGDAAMVKFFLLDLQTYAPICAAGVA